MADRKEKREKKEKKEKKETPSESSPQLLEAIGSHTGIRHQLKCEDAPIDSVTVYADRAEVTRKIKLSPEKEGVQDIIISGFTSKVDENSVRVAGINGNAIIMEVSYDVIIPPPPSATEEADPEKKLEIQKQLKKLEKEVGKVKKEIARTQVLYHILPFLFIVHSLHSF
jgi:hypothetical protein